MNRTVIVSRIVLVELRDIAQQWLSENEWRRVTNSKNRRLIVEAEAAIQVASKVLNSVDTQAETGNNAQ